jgi:hypothetical protein
MPIHDWTRVDGRVYEAFHLGWSTCISRALNRTVLPKGCYALVQQGQGTWPEVPSNVVIRSIPRHHTLAKIEIVLPATTKVRRSIDQAVRLIREDLNNGVHVLVIELVPGSDAVQNSLVQAIWHAERGTTLASDGKPRSCVSFVAGENREAYVAPVAVGESLIEMPLFMAAGHYVSVPLESTYRAAYDDLPEYWRDVLSGRTSGGAEGWTP